MTLTDSKFSGNTGCWAGGVYNEGYLTVGNSTISGNTSQQLGGGIYNYSGGALSVIDCTITGNTAAIGGGAASSRTT